MFQSLCAPGFNEYTQNQAYSDQRPKILRRAEHWANKLLSYNVVIYVSTLGAVASLYILEGAECIFGGLENQPKIFSDWLFFLLIKPEQINNFSQVKVYAKRKNPQAETKNASNTVNLHRCTGNTLKTYNNSER